MSRIVPLALYAVLTLAFALHALPGTIGSGLVARGIELGAGLWGAATLLLLTCGVGRRILRTRLLAGCAPGSTGRIVLSFTAGAFVLGSLWTVLALAGLLGTVSIAVTTASLAVFAIDGLGALRGDIARAVTMLGPPGAARLAWMAALVVFLLPYGLQTLLPEHDWDSVSYHLPVARDMVESGAWTLDPILQQAAFPAAAQLFYAVLLAVGLETAVMPFNLLVALLLVLAAHAVASHVWGRSAGLLAFATALATNIVLELGLDARTDQFLGLFCAAAALAYLAWSARPQRAGALLLAGAALGLAAGTKYTAGVVVLWIGGSVLVALRRPEARTRASLLALAGGGALLLTALWWYGRNFLVLGDPLYPFLEGRKFYDASGTLGLVAPAVEAVMARMPPPPADFLNDPYTATAPAGMLAFWELVTRPSAYANKDLHWIPFLVFAGMLVPAFDRRPRSLWCWAFAWGSFVLTAWAGNLIRYLFPFLAAMAATTGAVLARAPITARRVLLAILLGNAVWNSAAEWRKLTAMEPGDWFTGRQSHDEFLSRVGYNKALGTANAMRVLNATRAAGEIPPGDKILMVGEWKSFHFDNPTLADLSYDGLRWLAELARHGGDHAAIRESLQQRGVGMLLVNPSYLAFCRTHYPMDDERLSSRRFQRFALHELQQFLAKYGRQLWSGAGTFVYRLQ